MTTYLQGTRQIYAFFGKAYWHGQFQPAKHSGEFSWWINYNPTFFNNTI